MVVAIFKLRYLPNADHAAEAVLGERMYGLVSQVPGFISIKGYTGEDGEVTNLVEFDSLASLEQWRDHPEHLAAKLRHSEFYESYQLQICDVLRTYGTGAKE
jgi:heme-degrading monooxygenase HmoA